MSEQVPYPDLLKSHAELIFRVEALERLPVALAAMVPELRSIVRTLPDPMIQGAEFLGRRHAGSAEAGARSAEMIVEAWRKLIAKIDAVSGPSRSA